MASMTLCYLQDVANYATIYEFGDHGSILLTAHYQVSNAFIPLQQLSKMINVICINPAALSSGVCSYRHWSGRCCSDCFDGSDVKVVVVTHPAQQGQALVAYIATLDHSK